MSKKNVATDNTNDVKAIGVNTPERIDEMDEKEFYNEDAAQEDLESTSGDSSDNDEATSGENAAEDEGGEAPRGFIAFVKKHWKMLVAIGAITIVGGFVFIYFMGKTYKVDAKKFADVIPFAKKDNAEIVDEQTAQAVIAAAKELANEAEKSA